MTTHDLRVLVHSAASMCEDGDTIILCGTAVGGMAGFVTARGMRVLTDSFRTAREWLAASDNDVYVTGGRIVAPHGALRGAHEGEVVRHYAASRLFMGASGLSALGVMETDPSAVRAARHLIERAEQVVVLADSDMFARRDGLFVCGLERVSCLITDAGLADTNAQLLERAGVRVVVAEPAHSPRGPCSSVRTGGAYDAALLPQPAGLQ